MEKTDLKAKGIPIRKLNYIMAAITLIVSIVLLIVSYNTIAIYNNMNEKTEMFMEGQKCASDMQNASDYLTEQIRCFVESGEKEYLDAYFYESEVSKRREKALEKLAVTFKESPEYQDLEKAKEQSMILMETEYYAARLAIEGFGYDVTTYPQAIQDVVLSNDDLLLTSEEMKTKARMLVFDDNYHNQKDVISTKTQECLNKLVAKLQVHQEEASRRFDTIIKVEQGLIIALIVIVLIIVALTTIQVIRPLIKAIPNIRDDKPIPISGSEEFRYLANTYNRIYEENKNQKEELAYEASHDQLTGVFNRKGFEELLITISHSKVALLLIDIDRFKRINDTYGHTEGDKVLLRMTKVVAKHFRSSDTLCRIGGDEFVMFINGIGEESSEVISNKIKDINIELEKGEEDIPPASISVGVAFGDNEDGMKIYKKADIALYKVKESGRCDCAFYTN
ncbi:MAG: GGDEF domain-containing protein [Bacilli bacterium]|nr:GGDEF domain-containing protein [Bacilli bacterium]